LERYTWPGNVRELQNVIQRIVVLGTESVVDELDEPAPRPSPPPNGPAAALAEVTEGRPAGDSPGLKELARRAVETVEREALTRMLTRVHWRRVEAAHRLRISYKTLLEKIKHYGLDPPDA
ncbi:MAG: helix-turn-helix domain-containing protein, partial [Candidatus Rokuibacteriota bacterium]